METETAIFATDEVNLQGVAIPVAELASMLQRNIKTSSSRGLPPGWPTHIGHDLHRLAAWAVPKGLTFAADRVVLLGSILRPSDEQERDALHQLATAYFESASQADTAPYMEDLNRRLAGLDFTGATAVYCGAACLLRTGLAAEAYPEFFALESEAVDGDGLVDLSAFLIKVKEVQPGVFRDLERGLLLFAHPYFRRRQSRRNTLNEYVLSRITSLAREQPDVAVRLRLDPDLVGHPDSTRVQFEFEYWHGPRFDADISRIPTGVTVHKADERTQLYEGIDQTQICWKDSARRGSGDAGVTVRTLEAEELVGISASGISEQQFACRYVHAEYTETSELVTHFDGAIRAYPDDAYMSRLDVTVDRAGRAAVYTKLFRTDGSLGVPEWKALLTDFYKGNPLLAEYLGGAKAPEPLPARAPLGPAGQNLECGDVVGEPCLVIHIAFHDRLSPARMSLLATRGQHDDGSEVAFVELPPPNLGGILIQLLKFEKLTIAKWGDRMLNFPPILFGSEEEMSREWRPLLTQLAEALEADVRQSAVEGVCFAFDLPHMGLVTSLSIAGEASAVLDGLRNLENAVDVRLPASAWVANLKAVCERHAHLGGSSVCRSLDLTDTGHLFLPHGTDAEVVHRASSPPD